MSLQIKTAKCPNEIMFYIMNSMQEQLPPSFKYQRFD